MDITNLISQMTLEEKAGLCSGGDFWHTKAVERLGIPAIMMSDGPHGLRKQADESDHLGINDSIKAVCFPTGSALAASFDRNLARTIGESIGEACQAENLAVILGPAMNIKRSPLCGRNFEYLSEDPYLAGEMATGQIKGVQSKHVGTSVKHFMANNQEFRRMSTDSRVDERTMREIYLAPFEMAVKQAQPWTVMCSYNRINGTYASDNRRVLTEILRDEWGFEGFVVSDWGAVNDRVAGIAAGMDLEMPTSNGLNDARIVEAVKNGTLAESDLDKAVANILRIIDRFNTNRDTKAVFDREIQHELAAQAAIQTMVLLKNDDGILPLEANEPTAFIGRFAEKPRYQGGGSSHINSSRVVGALEAVAGNNNISYAPGYNLDSEADDEALLAQAVETARTSSVAVIFAGLPDNFESEGYDRSHMGMPKNQLRLIAAVAAVQPRTVVVMHNGSPVEMPWIDKVPGILEAYLGGQAIGQAVVDVLFGAANPSGRLAETFPLKLEDNPSYLSFGGENDVVEYREGIFVGYRYYDKKRMDVLFPFGHGLSYTTFAYGNLKLDKTAMKDSEILTVSVDITNTGKIAGREVVQLYVADLESTYYRPLRELKGFDKILLQPGEMKTVTFALDKRSFAYYNIEIKDWHVESGDFKIQIGRNSRDIICEAIVTVESTDVIKKVFTINSTFGDFMADEKARGVIKPMVEAIFAGLAGGAAPEAASDASVFAPEMMEAMVRDMPLRAAVMFSGGQLNFEMLENMLGQING